MRHGGFSLVIRLKVIFFELQYRTWFVLSLHYPKARSSSSNSPAFTTYFPAKPVLVRLVKVVVHSQRKILSSVNHPQVVPNLVRVSSLFWRMWVTKQSMGQIGFYRMERKPYGSQWGLITVWLTIFFKISSTEERNSYRCTKKNGLC